MAKSNSTRHSTGSPLSPPDQQVQSSDSAQQFYDLFRRLLVSISHVKLVTQHFGDLSSLDNEDAPAGLTLYEAAQDLDGLYNDLDNWYVQSAHVSKVARAAEIEDADVARQTPLPEPVGVDTDNTALRILTFVASMKPLHGQGCGSDEAFHRGRAIIERLAISAKEDRPPDLQLALDHCADVLKFLAGVEPLEPNGWWKDPEQGPSHVVGFQFVLQALEENIREIAEGRS